MKKHIIITFSILLSTFIISDVAAQAVRNAVERGQDRNQIARDKETLKRDQRELENFRTIKKQLGQAVMNGNTGGVANNHSALIQAMEKEIQQGEAKIAQASRERNQSANELNSSRREVRRDVGQGRPGRTADDVRDKRDDRRDLNDDRSDLREAKGRNARQKEILGVFKAIKVQGNPNVFQALKAKKNLLDEFEQTMVRDMNENVEELNEDRGELREDRRETREDRRQRR